MEAAARFGWATGRFDKMWPGTCEPGEPAGLRGLVWDGPVFLVDGPWYAWWLGMVGWSGSGPLGAVPTPAGPVVVRRRGDGPRPPLIAGGRPLFFCGPLMGARGKACPDAMGLSEGHGEAERGCGGSVGGVAVGALGAPRE